MYEMPFSIKFDQPPAGYAAAAAQRGDTIPVVVSEFVSSEDGDALIQRLEGIPAQILNLLPPEGSLAPAAVHTLLAVMRRDGTATIYLNDEIQIVARALAKRSVKAGEPLRRDDIADLQEITLPGIEVPKSAGVVFLFSVGWRKGLFYDLAPIQRVRAESRKYDLGRVLAGLFSYLVFNDLFKLTEQDWERLFAVKLFPFQSLRQETVSALLGHLREGWDLLPVIDRIAEDVDDLLEKLPKQIEGNPILSPHLSFLLASAKHYRDGEFVSAISVLYPRIEGIMRSHHLATGAQSKPTPANLVTSVLKPTGESLGSLLPDRFGRFLTDVFFQEFDPVDPKGVSRHTVSHGVASAEEYSRTGAMLGFLILSQLAFFLAGFVPNPRGA